MGVLEILGYLVGIGCLVCHILVIVKMFQAGQTGLGVACIILLFCCGIGLFITLIYGWMKAKDWNISTLMTIYTVLFIGNWALAGARFGEIRAQIEKQFQKQGN